jgi:hypothetical protein
MKDLSLHILDIVHNSISAKATFIQIEINENRDENLYQLMITDNGKGISPEILPTVTDPFVTSRKTRKVGMGLSLLKQNAERAGGNLEVKSVVGEGTAVTCHFQHNHLDRPAIGDISGTIVQLLASFPAIHFQYDHQTPGKEYIFDSDEIYSALGEVTANEPSIRKFLIEMIDENLDGIGIGR